MSYSRNFVSVRAQDDGTLRVNATSIDDATGEPGTEDPAVAFHVALVKAPQGGEGVVSTLVNRDVGGSWEAFFVDAAPKFADNPAVYVIGVAILEDGAAEIWQESHTIGTRTGEPFGSANPANPVA